MSSFLRVTLVTRRTDAAGCLGILDFLAGPLVPEPVEVKCALYSGATRKVLGTRSVSALVPLLADRRWNGLDLKFRLPSTAAVNRVAADCRLSPTCELWEPVAGAKSDSRDAHVRLMNYQSWEGKPRLLGPADYPSEMMLFVEFAPGADLGAIESSLHNLVADSLPKALGPGDVCGGGGLGDAGAPGRRARGVVDPLYCIRPGLQYNQIYDRIPLLMEIMVGSPEACRGVASAIGPEAAVAERLTEAGERIAVTHIPHRFVFDRAAQAACRAWTVTSIGENTDRILEERRRKGIF
jgi:hypothetical protein